MGIPPHNWICTKHQKHRGRAPGFCRTILNKQEGGMLYQTMRDSQLLIPRIFMTICKQPGSMRITTVMILWLLMARYIPHSISKSKQMSNKIDHY